MHDILYTFKVPELNMISCVVVENPLTGNKRSAVKVGAAVTLSAMEEYLNKIILKVIFLTKKLK